MGNRVSRMLGAAAIVTVACAAAHGDDPMHKLQPFGDKDDPFVRFIGMPFVHREAGHDASGTYQSQTYVLSSSLGPDGKMHTETYASSAVGDLGAQTQELRQAYEDSQSRLQRTAVERTLKEQGHKVVRERRQDAERQNWSEHSDVQEHQFFKGLESEQLPDFEKQWHEQAAATLPEHGDVVEKLMDGAGWLRPHQVPDSLAAEPTHMVKEEEGTQFPVKEAPDKERPAEAATAPPKRRSIMQFVMDTAGWRRPSEAGSSLATQQAHVVKEEEDTPSKAQAPGPKASSQGGTGP
eukprot:TRINITY_DN78336_c0_g1_i1.p1 TRINITY_DN78336_c0_g1~~TRINITY_DN78336_c0_g1_i1.p1  ORF type:complete len:294 (+),score=69.84 TRINITY_DN78336_c0_g1_i1:155-1036(+)